MKQRDCKDCVNSKPIYFPSIIGQPLFRCNKGNHYTTTTSRYVIHGKMWAEYCKLYQPRSDLDYILGLG